VLQAFFDERRYRTFSIFAVHSGNAKDLVKKVYLLDQVFFYSRRAFFQSHIAYGYTIGVFSREVKGISVKNLSIFIVSEGHTFLTSTSSWYAQTYTFIPVREAQGAWLCGWL